MKRTTKAKVKPITAKELAAEILDAYRRCPCFSTANVWRHLADHILGLAESGRLPPPRAAKRKGGGK